MTSRSLFSRLTCRTGNNLSIGRCGDGKANVRGHGSHRKTALVLRPLENVIHADDPSGSVLEAARMPIANLLASLKHKLPPFQEMSQ
jgi:hypothetical protein